MKPATEQKMLTSLIAILVVLAFACLCSLLVMSCAHARDYNENECYAIAKAAAQFAEHRDAGAEEPAVLLAVNEGMHNSRGNPTSYIKEDNDEDMMRSIVKLVFQNPSVTPSEFQVYLLQRCISKKLKTKES